MSENRTDLNVLILSSVGDSDEVAGMLASAGVNVVMFTVSDVTRGVTDDRGVYHAESWRTFIKRDFPDLVIYDDVNLYHKWMRAVRDKKGVPMLYLDSGVERKAIASVIRDVPVTTIASLLGGVSEPPIKWWQFWRRGSKRA